MVFKIMFLGSSTLPNSFATSSGTFFIFLNIPLGSVVASATACNLALAVLPSVIPTFNNWFTSCVALDIKAS